MGKLNGQIPIDDYMSDTNMDDNLSAREMAQALSPEHQT
jgi:hypothetical protein